MIRTKNILNETPPDAILCGDIHLRQDIPVCRTDDFESAQWDKLYYIKGLQKVYQCPVIHSGDLFNHWKPSPYLLSKAMEYLPGRFYTIYGNHDLPQHNLDEADKCGIYALERAGKLTVLPGVHWGQNPDNARNRPSICIQCGINSTDSRQILVYHTMTYQMKSPWPGIKVTKAGGLLRKYPEYDLILTGHNHQPFVEEHDDRLLVNPGSMMRQEADQIDFKPRVYLYYAKENRVQAVYIPISGSAVTRGHIERKEERENRIGAFIDKLDGDWSAGMSFENNLEEFFQVNKVRTSVKDIVYKAIES